MAYYLDFGDATQGVGSVLTYPTLDRFAPVGDFKVIFDVEISPPSNLTAPNREYTSGGANLREGLGNWTALDDTVPFAVGVAANQTFTFNVTTAEFVNKRIFISIERTGSVMIFTVGNEVFTQVGVSTATSRFDRIMNRFSADRSPNAKLYGLQCFDGTTLVRNYIPTNTGTQLVDYIGGKNFNLTGQAGAVDSWWVYYQPEPRYLAIKGEASTEKVQLPSNGNLVFAGDFELEIKFAIANDHVGNTASIISAYSGFTNRISVNNIDAGQLQWEVADARHFTNLKSGAVSRGEIHTWVLKRVSGVCGIYDTDGNNLLANDFTFTQTGDFLFGRFAMVSTGTTPSNIDLYYCTLKDNGVLTNSYQPSESNGVGYTLFDTIAGQHMELVGFTDSISQWVSYDDADGGGGDVQQISLTPTIQPNTTSLQSVSSGALVGAIPASQNNSAGLLLIQAAMRINAISASQLNYADVFNLTQSGAQDLALIYAEQSTTAFILTPSQQQAMIEIIATQLSDAGVFDLTGAQAISFIATSQLSDASVLSLDQFSGQVITIAATQQSSTTNEIFLNLTNSAYLVDAIQDSFVTPLSSVQASSISSIDATQLSESNLLNIITSGDNTDLSGLVLTPITNIYTLSTTQNIYTLEKQQ